MNNQKSDFLPETLLDQLKIINGIKFTHREIDILAFLVCGRTGKKIASFFSIAPKTVENHTHNVMLKLGCNSRESIIDFIEKSDKVLILRKYYATLLAHALFEKSLRELSQLIKEEAYSCILTYWEEQDSDLLIKQFENTLKFVNINVLLTPRNSAQSLDSLCAGKHVIYVSPKNQEDFFLSGQELNLLSTYPHSILFFTPGQQAPIEIFKDLEKGDFSASITHDSYYFLIFEIFRNLIANSHVEKIITDFETQYKVIKRTVEQNNSPLILEKTENLQKNKLNNAIVFIRKSRLLSSVFLIFVFGMIIVFYFEFKSGKEVHVIAQSSSPQKIHKRRSVPLIRSNLIIPTSTTLLNRPKLICLINERFKDWGGIQVIALVGIGGSGKTTLARQYARQQKTNIIWEINAATKETLNEAFEALAERLSVTHEDQRILMGITKLKDSGKREEKIVQFVKEKLRAYQNWFLIYDNVEKFIDIQNYFPRDSDGWGQGRVILTTQDHNIENNKYVNNTIVINELSREEKFNLFKKIMDNGNSPLITDFQVDKIKKFLDVIPPFPLDVSIAAYYLKATNVPYQSYLDKVQKCDHNFSNAQEKILQETGDGYTKTRYQIIAISLNHLMDKNKNFKELLLLACLLDSQSIPRNLFLKFKQENIVDEFIYCLKKYSLIINKNMDRDDLNSFFAMHRSTQSIILTYLYNILELNKNKNPVKSLAKILEQEISDAVEKEDFTKMKSLHRHAEHFIAQNRVLNKSETASLSGELGCICYYLCYYPRAQELLHLGISELNKHPITKHAKIAHFLVYSGNIHRRLGDYDKSIKLFEQSIELYKKSSELHTGMARAYGYLGITHESLGAFDKAKALLEKSLIIHKKSSKNKVGHAWSLAHLGSVYKNIGDYIEAKKLYEESFHIYKSSSPYHVGVAWVCRDLGFIYATLGEKEKAQSLLEESLAIYRQHFFEDHIYIAQALIYLGVFYRETKDFEKAKNLLKKGLVVIEKTYGKNHVDTGSVLKEIGKTFLAEGNLKIAEEMMNQTHSIFTKINHPDKYEVLEILATICQKKSLTLANRGESPAAMRLKAQARFYLAQALKVVKTYFPEDSPHSSRIRSKIKHEKQNKG